MKKKKIATSASSGYHEAIKGREFLFLIASENAHEKEDTAIQIYQEEGLAVPTKKK